MVFGIMLNAPEYSINRLAKLLGHQTYRSTKADVKEFSTYNTEQN